MKKYIFAFAILLVLPGCNRISDTYEDSYVSPAYYGESLDQKNREYMEQQRRDEEARSKIVNLEKRVRAERDARRAMQLQNELTTARLEAERKKLENEKRKESLAREEAERRHQREAYERARLESERLRQRQEQERVREENERRRRNRLNQENNDLQQATQNSMVTARAEERRRAQQQSVRTAADQENNDLQQAIQNSMVTARAEERQRVQQQGVSRSPGAHVAVDASEYRDNDYRLAGNIAMELSRDSSHRGGRQPTRGELISAWKSRIGINQMQAERIYADMFGG